MSKDKIVGVLSHTKGSELLKKLEQAGLTPELAQEVIESPNNHKANQIVGFLTHNENPFLIPSDPMEQWVALYKKYFDIDLDPSKIMIPAKKEGFNRLIIVAKGMKMQQVYDQLSKLFGCWKYTDKNLDDVVTHNDREATESYAIWVRDGVEADKENKSKSANDLAKENHTGITLLERLLLELNHFYTTSEHLDIKNITLCTGSRDADGFVPCVYWFGGDKMYVFWCNPSNALVNLRSREVVSA